ILIPASFTRWIGIPDEVYHACSGTAGFIAAIGVRAGVLVLAFRRLFVPRARATTSPVDWVALILLGIIIVTGIDPTVWVTMLGDGYHYRDTVAVWFRGLFAADPAVEAIAGAPLIYRVHATSAWFILAAWPFTRLVHSWSYPLWYMWRPYIVYRSRKPISPTEPGTSGRRWRRIGARYCSRACGTRVHSAGNVANRALIRSISACAASLRVRIFSTTSAGALFTKFSLSSFDR